MASVAAPGGPNQPHIHNADSKVEESEHATIETVINNGDQGVFVNLLEKHGADKTYLEF